MLVATPVLQVIMALTFFYHSDRHHLLLLDLLWAIHVPEVQVSAEFHPYVPQLHQPVLPVQQNQAPVQVLEHPRLQ